MGNSLSITPVVSKGGSPGGMEQGQLNIHFGLSGDDRNRMRDTDVVNFLNDDDDDVNPDRVTSNVANSSLTRHSLPLLIHATT